jgi:hypothetical protein
MARASLLPEAKALVRRSERVYQGRRTVAFQERRGSRPWEVNLLTRGTRRERRFATVLFPSLSE